MNVRFHSRAIPAELQGNGRFVLPRKDFVPAYVRAFEDGVLQERAEQAVESLRSCRVCPRDCEIDRFNNKIGVCKSGRLARVASAFPRGGLPARLERVGHNLLRLVQSTMRVLPELRDEPAW